ncbi:MAG: hypothetical protein H0V70_29215 [Ktedonobacteraceae bacterium]|nr:hypothetical protein [Ktedonobacteraceae bacterium]
MSQRIDTETFHMAWDDAWHRIEVNRYILNLSPTQYRIFRAFLSISVLGTPTGELTILAYRSCDDLQEEADLSHRLLSKHISKLNARIVAMGLQVRFFQAGYILTLSSNLVQKVRSGKQEMYHKSE